MTSLELCDWELLKDKIKQANENNDNKHQKHFCLLILNEVEFKVKSLR